MAGAASPQDAQGPFESHLEALEKVVADLEGDALSLEASIARYQEGVGHLAACRRILDAAEQRLAELVQAADGTVTEQPLAVGPEGLVDAGPPGPRSSAASSPPATPPVKTTSKASGKPPRKAAPSTDPGDDLPF